MNKPSSSKPPDGDCHNFGSSSARLVLIIQAFQVKALQEVLEDKNGYSPPKKTGGGVLVDSRSIAVLCRKKCNAGGKI